MDADRAQDIVALRKESVDRNNPPIKPAEIGPVALRKESVDRNNRPNGQKHINSRSLSARRAWIEIIIVITIQTGLGLSLSARRAWIEITV